MKRLLALLCLLIILIIPSAIRNDPISVEVLDTQGIVERLDKAFGIWVDVKKGPIEGEFIIRVGIHSKILLEFPYGNQVIIKENSTIKNDGEDKDNDALGVVRG